MRPLVAPVTEELYTALLPLAWEDEQHDWATLKLLEASAFLLQEIEDLVRDTPAGPGWSVVMDVNRAPAKWLGWLAQFAGVQLRGGLSDAAQRARVASTDGQQRGTPNALIGAARQYLTGAQTVILRERDGSAYRLTIITYTSQTPSQSQVLAAMLEQKPAGLVLNYLVLTGQDYTSLRARNASYTAMRSAYASYQVARDLQAA